MTTNVCSFELSPTGNQKSFYGKATVIITEDGTRLLKSYDTIVAKIDKTGAHILGWYSQTTTKHVKSFLETYGYAIGTKAQMQKMYC